MRRIFLLLAALTCGAWSYGASPQPWIGHQVVTVSGDKFLKDGTPWVPQGFNVFATIAPTCCIDTSHTIGYANYSIAELTAIRNIWHGDVVRYQVSLPALATDSPMYNLNDYIGIMKQRISDARSLGLVVIISLNSISTSGWAQYSAQPDISFNRQPDVRAQQVWHWLAETYKNDLGIMFELFNEQNNENPNTDTQPISASPTPNAWWIWKNINQPLVDTIRATGAQNVIIAEGLEGGHYLENVSLLDDPTGNIAYAEHPYPVYVNYPTNQYINFVVSGDMETHWGYLSTTHPVIITEWYTGSAFDCWDSSSVSSGAPDTSPDVVKTLLDYIKSIGVGLVAFNFDTPGRYATDTTWTTPTQMQSPFTCQLDPDVGSPGREIFNYFTQGIAP